MALLINRATSAGSDEGDLIWLIGSSQVSAAGGGGDDIVSVGRRAAFQADSTLVTSLEVAERWNPSGTANPLVDDSSVPSTTIYGRSSGGYVTCSVFIDRGSTMTLDIDGTRTASGIFDAYVEVLDAATGAVLAQFDDSGAVGEGGLGSIDTSDSFGKFTAPAGGTYLIRVGRYATASSSQPLSEGDNFALAVSVVGHPAAAARPAPTALLNGDAGADLLIGNVQDDVLIGGTGSDRLYGDAGDDRILWFDEDGSDVVDGGAGAADTLALGGAGSGWNIDLSTGTASNGTLGDTLTLAGIERIEATAFADRIVSGGFGTTILAGAGDDAVFARSIFAETFDGGEGIDTLDLAGFDKPEGTYELDMASGTNQYGVLYTKFENLVIGNSDDTITGTDGANQITTRGGDDRLSGLDGDDVLAGGEGSNLLDGGTGFDFVSYADASRSVIVTLERQGRTQSTFFSNDRLTDFEGVIGSDFRDTITGDAADNELRGGAGNDTLSGGDGDDTLVGGDGSDDLIGGDGYDIATYADAKARVVVDLSRVNERQDTFGAGRDLLREVEGLIGSAQLDQLTGDAGSNIIIGGKGDDQLAGGDGDDTFIWNEGDGSDRIDGGEGGEQGGDTLTLLSAASSWTVDLRTGLAENDSGDELTLFNIEYVIGTEYFDVMYAGAGGITLAGAGGNDLIYASNELPLTVDGGDGIDTLDTTEVTGIGLEYTINLATGTTNFVGERIDNFENLVSGETDDAVTGTRGANMISTGSGRDGVIGDDGRDTIDGGDGADVLNGGRGVDRITGGNGKDVLIGGFNADTFVFDLDDSAATIAGADLIRDFHSRQNDRIDLRAIDAVAGTARNEAFTFLGLADFSGTAGELRYRFIRGNDMLVEGDVDGDRIADFAIRVNGTINLIEKDFIL